MEKSIETRNREASKELRKVLDTILAKDEGRLTTSDKDFLRARRGYLSSVEIAKYESVFGESDIEEVKKKKTKDDLTIEEEYEKIKLIPLEAMSLDQLKVVAKYNSVRGAHLYQDREKLLLLLQEVIELNQ